MLLFLQVQQTLEGAKVKLILLLQRTLPFVVLQTRSLECSFEDVVIFAFLLY